jgi:hypothetical protein
VRRDAMLEQLEPEALPASVLLLLAGAGPKPVQAALAAGSDGVCDRCVISRAARSSAPAGG